MRHAFKVFFIVFTLSSCAKIPIQSVNLMDALAEEGNRMHQINMAFLNSIFKAKKEKVDEFIRTQYAPKFIADFQKNIPKDADVKAELPNIMNAIAPKIAERRDAMQSALEDQRIKLASKLELDYKTFESAAEDLRTLLVSAAEVDKGRQQLMNKTKALSKGTIDLNAVEGSIDRFIISGGNFSNDLSDLNTAINSIIKK
ncbi:MAG: hypothetical protein JWQ09_4889 [Segetibacter sp.]|nr:hypothetical protein [Segetibacter sp.]